MTLKLKDNHFKSITRSRSLSDPTQLTDKIFSIGKDLLLKELATRPKHLPTVGHRH